MKLLALIFLLSAFPSMTLTEVVQNFDRWNCGEFFMKKPGRSGDDRIIPTIFTGHQYKKICQRWNNRYRFATVYDTERRIPVYSAYTFTQQVHTARINDWKIEPQLENIQGNNAMEDSPREYEHITHQAVDTDYSSTLNSKPHTRGHVFPNLFAADRDQADSTFTLTNIAPQTGNIQQEIENDNGWWEWHVEQPMLRQIIQNCRRDQNNPAYIVTGVVPGNNWIPIKRNNVTINNGINIPSYYWSAFCCKDINGRLVSGTYIAKQGAMTVQEFKVRRPSMENLNKQLTELYRQDFSVFPGLDC